MRTVFAIYFCEVSLDHLIPFSYLSAQCGVCRIPASEIQFPCIIIDVFRILEPEIDPREFLRYQYIVDVVGDQFPHPLMVRGFGQPEIIGSDMDLMADRT